MNYNDYDSNGNKKDFNVSDMFHDKKQRSRLILLFYGIIFIILIIFARTSYSSSTKNVKENDEDIEKIGDIENPEDSEINEIFSLINSNNYDFKFTIEYKYNDNEIINSNIEGKKYNNKYDFSLTSNDLKFYFLGYEERIKFKENEDGEYYITDFPYEYLNIFDNDLLKEIIKQSELKNDNYEITNEKLNNIIDESKTESLENKDAVNIIDLITKNGKIIGITIDYSNALSDYTKEKKYVKVILEYSNFGSINDFDIKFE